MTSYRNAAISFPMLGDWFSVNPNPDISIFGFTFHWYGVIIAIGFILAVWYCSRRCREFGITQDDLIDMLIAAVPLAIIGARAYYVIFNYSLYRDNFVDVFKIWEGGLAIYGGVIFAVIGVAVVCRVKKLSFGAMLDVGSFGLLIGQSVGRWANFVNREAFGRTTDIFCRMGFTLEGHSTVYVHPTFLYESLWNLVGFIALHIISKKTRRKYDGQYFLYYLGWYGLGRMMIEGLRTDSLYLFSTSIRVSQLLAGVCLLVVLIVLFINRCFRYHDEEKLWVNRRAAMAASAGSPDTAAEAAGSVSEPEEVVAADPAISIIPSTLADDEIVDKPVVEPIDVVLHDSDADE